MPCSDVPIICTKTFFVKTEKSGEIERNDLCTAAGSFLLKHKVSATILEK
jgi:hypothetical protein